MSEPGERLGSAGTEPVPQQPQGYLVEEKPTAEAKISDAPLDPQLVDWHTSVFLEMYEGGLRDRIERQLISVHGPDIDWREIADIALIEAWFRLPEFRGTQETGDKHKTQLVMHAWISSIARKQVFQYLRGRYTYGDSSLNVMMMNEEFQPAETLDCIEAAEDHIDRSALLKLLWDNADLTPEQAQALIARRVLEMDAVEVAEVLGIPAGTVRAREFRARARLFRTAVALNVVPWDTREHTVGQE